MAEEVVLVLDCGATNIRTIAVNRDGKIKAVSSLRNETSPDPEYPEYRIWDVDLLWDKFKKTTRDVIQRLSGEKIVAVTVDTFGVDGAPFDARGNMLYPVISWQCKRTAPVMSNIEKFIPLEKLYRINGLQPFTFNTINKLIWLKENKREVFEKMHHFLFISSIFLYRLTGEMVTDTSMAGTSMLTDIRKRDFSDEILAAIGVGRNLFPRMAEPGEAAGETTAEASRALGIPEGIPVIVTGHDTQFAIFGSGAQINVPVLSSGTWEILMVRAQTGNIVPAHLQQGITYEFDPTPGLVNAGIQWIASGTLEWIRRMFYSRESDHPDIYRIMTGEGGSVTPGSMGVRVNPSFFPGAGDRGAGVISGLTMDIPRGAVYRAALEALACKTLRSLETLQHAAGFTAKHLVCVGGGSKNPLWNQIRADILNIPVRVVKQSETTVMGAAMFAFTGTGYFHDASEAQLHFTSETEEYLPENPDVYQQIIKDYSDLLS